jgi:hypothetical protein
MKAQFTHKRPIGVITIEVEPEGEGCRVLRIEKGIFGENFKSISIAHPYEETVEGISKWTEGELVQDALPNWTPSLREWLITGNHWEVV